MNDRSERGTIIIMVAVCLLALALLSGLVVDQGILYAARSQAQSSADAAAIAGAWARVRDDMANPPASKTSGVIWQQVTATAARNPVWGIPPPSATILLDWTCPQTGTTQCVVVDVFRDGTHSSQTLPTSFLQLGGITSQRARAHAVAWPTAANETDCLRPWFVLDRAGGGYTTGDIGTQIVLDSQVTPSGFGKLDVGSGESAIVSAVHSCVTGTFDVGQTVPTQTGAAGHPTSTAVNDVIDWDLGAHYDATTKTIQGSCAPTCNCAPYVCPNVGKGMSPRVFVAPLCDPAGDAGCASGGNGSTHQITITSFLSFFIESATSHGNDIRIVATIIGGAGNFSPTGGTATSAFLQTVRLIR